MKVIRFGKTRILMVMVSVAVIAGGAIGTIVRGGFNLGIDFQAGLSIHIAVDPAKASADIESVRAALGGVTGAQVQTIGDGADQQFVVRVSDPGDVDSFSSVVSEEILRALGDEFGAGAVQELESTFVGPRFSQDLTRNTVILTALALGVILLYIWFRFRLGYATASITALVHDVAIMFVFIGTFQIEVSTATIAAVLTIIGYSLNDTIVIFDRIRENETILRESDFGYIIDASITQSLSRTLITSLTTLLAVSAIYVFATGAVQLFALNLLVGVTVGTYSSIFIASPVLFAWQRGTKKRKARRDSARHGSPTAVRTGDSAKAVTPAEQIEQATADKKRVIEEISRKRAAATARGGQRSKKKKK